jgi:hypothetical protein
VGRGSYVRCAPHASPGGTLARGCLDDRRTNMRLRWLTWPLALCAVCCLGLGTAPAADEKPAPPFDIDKFVKGRSELARRVNGVLLQATVTVAKQGFGEEVNIKWTLDYDGPRPPLIILRPTLKDMTSEQTAAVFYAVGKDRNLYEYAMKSPHLDGFVPTGSQLLKGAFLTLEKGKTATGVLPVPAGKIGGYYRDHWPKQFDDKPPLLYLQLRHKPYDRGLLDNLDAWTGELLAPVVKVPLTKW